MSVTIEPTTSTDVAEFFPSDPPFRIRALTARLDGKVIGIGGITYRPDGIALAFLECSEEHCRKYPKRLHATAKRVIDEAKAAGIKRIIAKVDGSRERAAAWLKRLGFEPIGETDGQQVYQWQP